MFYMVSPGRPWLTKRWWIESPEKPIRSQGRAAVEVVMVWLVLVVELRVDVVLVPRWAKEKPVSTSPCVRKPPGNGASLNWEMFLDPPA